MKPATKNIASWTAS